MDVVTRESLGRVGIWSLGLGSTAADATRRTEIAEAVAELDELGYGTLWLGGSPSVADAAAVLAATRRITVATGILSIWDHTPHDVAAQVAALEEEAPGRFVLGLGVSHSVVTPRYTRPYTSMVEYLDALDGAPVPVPRGRRVLAALGPKMLALAGDRTLGAHPYLVTAEHTAQARTVLGPDALLAPELKVVLDTDLDRARALAHQALAFYLRVPNYVGNLRRLGFKEDELTGGGADRVVDALFALGDAGQAAARVREHLEAGADHVSVQVVTEGAPGGSPPRAQWRELAAALPLR
ncbi:LLM class F420-dependent oxidoreductase [Nonomuraea jiangxiensis]|uniref:Probable F420-dependent oxidoreductase, MSMEG_4141 family n=1 Tax=Nonomuraea jiangxiensis TaxID=633440 RepID=A0A1G9F701_9ACTN|nr:LLM class F420-dependent oxidoreductase [Nonomuraea jiangxiensis]SDK84199.1 probable F420-dependent oxidoreductase, MSMEG_4141 family [Nonomuraea jiangxiensis]